MNGFHSCAREELNSCFLFPLDISNGTRQKQTYTSTQAYTKLNTLALE